MRFNSLHFHTLYPSAKIKGKTNNIWVNLYNVYIIVLLFLFLLVAYIRFHADHVS